MDNATVQEILETRFDELNGRILSEVNTFKRERDIATLEKLHIRRDEVLMLSVRFGCSAALNRKVWVESGVF